MRSHVVLPRGTPSIRLGYNAPVRWRIFSVGGGMLADLFIMAGMVALLAGMDRLHLIPATDDGSHAALVLGFILLTGFLAGRVARRLHAPMITGYLVAGILFGPYLLASVAPSLGVIPPEVLDKLSVFNHIALGLIAFSAGGELKIQRLREQLRSIGWVTLLLAVSAFALIVPVVVWIGPRFQFLSGQTTFGVLAVALLFAVIAVATSPASTIALIFEYRAVGPLTTTTLGVTMLKDVVVIVAFSVILTVAEPALVPGGVAGHGVVALHLAWEILGSIGAGILLGLFISLYVRHVGQGFPLVLLAISFVSMVLSAQIGLSGLLMCMIAGFLVENFTDRGEALIQGIERYSLPVFIIFFVINGANLDWSALPSVWPLVVFLITLRLIAIWAGAGIGSWLAGDPAVVRRYLWLGFLTQAGVTLGLATVIEARLPGIGAETKTIVAAMIAINLIIGPIAFRFGLVRSGEARTD